MSSLEIIREYNKKAAAMEQQLLRVCIDDVSGGGSAVSTHPFAIRDLGQICLQRILGMSVDAEKETSATLQGRLSDALSGMGASGECAAFLARSDGAATSFYFGGTAANLPLITASVQGGLENAVWAPGAPVSLRAMLTDTASDSMRFGGVITGMPIVPEKDQVFRDPARTIINGMQGVPFAMLYLFMRCERNDILANLAAISEQQSILDEQLNIQITATETNTIARSVTMYNVKRCAELLERIEAHLMDAVAGGGWRVFGAYLAATQSDAQRLGGLIQTALGGQGSGPEPMRAPMMGDILNKYLCNGFDKNPFMVPGTREVRFTTTLSSRQLASMILLPEREVPGFFVNEHVEFDVNTRKAASDAVQLEIGGVLSSVYAGRQVGRYAIPREDLDRHALVVGATGGGKSNTTRMLLTRLWKQGIPFMVIESAKSEYWQLARLRDFRGRLCALQLGDIHSPFRLNPFECIRGFSLQTHVDSLLATFNAAFEMYPPMPYILERAVYQVYSHYGWNVATGENTPPPGLGSRASAPPYPTLADLYLEIPRVVAQTAYDSEVKNNVQGALQTRIRSLMIGGKGAMMDVRASTPMESLLSMPLVLELESLGDDAIKSFCIGLLMNRLYEYRRAASDGESKPFSHLLVLEEAHRLLKRVSEQGDSAQAASVAFFCNMLSEIRSYGQGILIADQSPTKLAQDAIRNTNIKIVHRIVDSEDRQAVGGAMHMNENQINALTVLERGCAAVYSEGDHRPRIVRLPLLKYDDARISRAQVLNDSRGIVSGLTHDVSDAPCMACPLCMHWKSGRCANTPRAEDARTLAEHFRNSPGNWTIARELFEDRGPSEDTVFDMVEAAFKFTDRAIQKDPRGAILPECAGVMLCAAGTLLKSLGLSAAHQQIAMERFRILLARKMMV